MSAKLLNASLLCLAASTLAAAPPPQTVDATIPIEVLAVDPALATGGIPLQRTWSSPRIAMQPARAARATVLEKNGDVLTLALIEPVERAADGKARLDGPADRIAWCAAPHFISNFLACYQDLDSDGKFETSRTGMLGTDQPLALSRLQEPKTIEPLAFRAATESELPRFQVGYRACGATLDDPHTFEGPLRYETVVRRAEGVQWPKLGRCDSVANLLETKSDGARLYQMGRFKIEVREKDENELSTTLIEAMAPGTLLAHVRTSWPLTDATERPKDADAISDQTPFLVAVGKPIIAAAAKPGDEIFSVEVRHGLTGHLKADSEPRVKRDKLRLPAGTPLYGIAMRSSLTPYFDAQVVWCTPVAQPDGKTQPFCFAPSLSSSALVRAYSTPYTVTGVAPSGPVRNPPMVEPGPVDFGAPLVLVVKVGKADRKTIGYTWSLAPRGQWFEQAWNLRRARDQNGLLLIGELLLKIKAADDGQSFEISTVGQLDEGTSLYLPTDAVRLLR
jgi:hypothetical protein